MKEELVSILNEKYQPIYSLRKFEDRIQVKILNTDSEIAWIELFQAPYAVEKMIRKWILLGGEIG